MTTPASFFDDSALTPADRLAMGERPPSVRVKAPRPVSGTPSSAGAAAPAGGHTPGGTATPAWVGQASVPPTGSGPGPDPHAPEPEPSATGPAPGTPESTGPAPWPGTTGDASSGPAGPPHPPAPGDPSPARRDRLADDARPADDEDELPEPPARPGAGRHLLGVLLGLLLTPAGLLLSAVGTARLTEVAGTADMGTDALGAIVLGVGLALLATVVLLGAWTPALPLTGGLVWGVGLGTAYLVVPGLVEDTIARFADDTHEVVVGLGEAAMSGHLLAVGVLLTVAGLTAGLARRRGRRWAEGVAAAEAARARLLHARRDQGGPTTP